MSIVVGENSWVTLLEADTYLENKNNAESWFSFNDAPATPGSTSKESFLVEAFYRLLYNPEFLLTASLSDTFIKNAQIEFAFWLSVNYLDFTKREAKTASGISDFTFSKWKEKLSGVSLPWIVEGMIAKSGYSYSNLLIEVNVTDD